MGRLTTHVLDTAAGRPAAGLQIGLFRGHGAGAEPLASARTNADGRVDRPLLEGDAFAAGPYELRFHVGAYFEAAGAPDCFYDIAPVAFVVRDPSQHFHVPLLIAPFGYSTYRGS